MNDANHTVMQTTFVGRSEMFEVSGALRIMSRSPDRVAALAAAADLERRERTADVIEDVRRSFR